MCHRGEKETILTITIHDIFSGQKRNSRLGVDPGQTGLSYAPNFSSPRTIEGHVINCIFKPFVTRLTASLKFLKSSENVVRIAFRYYFYTHILRNRFIRLYTATYANYWPISRMCTAEYSVVFFSADYWIRPQDRNSRKTPRPTTEAISSK